MKKLWILKRESNVYEHEAVRAYCRSAGRAYKDPARLRDYLKGLGL